MTDQTTPQVELAGADKLMAEQEFSLWMMFYIGAGNVGLTLLFTWPTAMLQGTGGWWHVAAMIQFMGMMVGPVWMAALFYWATTGFQPDIIPQEPMFSTYRNAVDIWFWAGLGCAIVPLMMTIDTVVMAGRATVSTATVETAAAAAATAATTPATTTTTTTDSNASSTQGAINAYKVLSLIMVWCQTIASFVLMYMYVGQFRLWHDLMSIKVTNDYLKRWERDYPDGKLPVLQEDPFAYALGEKVAEGSPEDKKIQRDTRKSQEDYLNDKNKDNDTVAERPTSNPEPTNDTNSPKDFGDKTADAFDQDAFEFVF